MDFGKILEYWETKNQKNSHNSAYPDKDKYSRHGTESNSVNNQGKNLKNIKKMKAQAVLDLHGYTSAEAEKILQKFLLDSRNRGYIKVCVIHGKGIHSEGESVLTKVVDNVLRECPYAGMTGFSQQKDGGKGSRWIIIK